MLLCSAHLHEICTFSHSITGMKTSQHYYRKICWSFFYLFFLPPFVSPCLLSTPPSFSILPPPFLRGCVENWNKAYQEFILISSRMMCDTHSQIYVYQISSHCQNYPIKTGSSPSTFQRESGERDGRRDEKRPASAFSLV